MTDFTEIIPKLEQYNNMFFSINILDFGTIHLLVEIQ